MSDGVGLRYTFRDVVVTVSDGHILHDVARMDHMWGGAVKDYNERQNKQGVQKRYDTLDNRLYFQNYSSESKTVFCVIF